MTDETTLEFDTSTPLGAAFRVDTGSVWAEAVDHETITKVGVNSLVAFQGSTATEYLIGILDRVTRDLYDAGLEETGEGDDFEPVESRQRDLFRVVLLGTYRKVEGTKRNTFKRGADSYPLVDALCWVVAGTNLQRLMGALSKDVEETKRLSLGHFVSDKTATAVADGDRLFQRHAALLGSTGAGKSWAVALILEKAKQLESPNLIVFDMHGEYGPLSQGEDPIARSFKLANSSIQENDEAEILHLPWWLLNQEEMQSLLLDRSESNAPNQAARLSHHVRELKLEALKARDNDGVAAQFTVDSPVPYSLEQLLERLQADDEQRVEGSRGPKNGPFFGTLTRFLTRMRARTEDRRYSFMFAPGGTTSEYEWLHQFAKDLLGTKPGIKVIDFSEVPAEVLPVVVAVLARVLYEIHFWTDPLSRTPVTLVCDEAHLYLPNQVSDTAEQRALESFERIAKEGRKYGISLLVVSQRPSDLSRTVLSQCNNFMVLRLTNDQDQAVIRRLMPDNQASLTGALPLLDVGEALLIGDAMVLPTRIKLDQPKVKPRSATLSFWSEWSNRAVDDADLVSAVESMRRQSRLSAGTQ
ncbi:ATP-binding protein [Nesterenkonia sp. CF4.4]|uniref:ATP-binding protein n=1 Tax=Nesterenkonia sp. CF4.4 TaxID=3373079 RepID=UPI003EE79726